MQLILGHFFQKPLVMYGWTELCPFRRANAKCLFSVTSDNTYNIVLMYLKN